MNMGPLGIGVGVGLWSGRGGGAAPVLVPVNSVAPAAAGTGTVGQILSVTTGTWSNSPTGYTYQWKRDGVNIASATANTYTLVTADAGTTTTCAVTASNVAGSGSPATSNGISVAVLVPVNSVAPVASGTATVGSLLSVTNGTWSGSPTGYTYQWKRAGTNIGSATASTYTLVTADGGQSITCAVTASNAGGSGSPATSNAILVATELPALANIVARWSPDDTAKLNGGVAPSDGTAISSFQDSVSGITLTQGTGANQPIYKASGKGGKPYLLMAAAKNLSVTTNATLNTAMSGGIFTVMAFYRNITGASFNIVCSSGTSPNNFFAGASGYTPASTTTYSAGVSLPAAFRIPYNGSAASTDLQSVGLSNGYTAGGAIGGFSQVILNGCSQLAGGGTSGNNGTFSLGITSSANSMIGELYDVIIWNKALSPQETLQVHKWACDKYTQTPPWVTYGKFYVALGSSQAAGTGATTPGYDNYATKAARDSSIPVGCYAICGYSAQNATSLSGMAAQGLYGVPALLGVPTNLSWLEYYNTRLQADPSITVLAAVNGIKAAGFNKIGLLTLTDAGDHATSRATYLTGVIAGYAANGVNDLIRIDLDGVANVSGVGVVNSAFTGSTYFDPDLIHQTTLGYTTIASYLTPVLSSW